MTEKAVGVAFVGAGIIAEMHGRGVTANPRAKLVGVYDPKIARATAIAKKFGGRVYRSLEQLLSDPRVEVVHVLTPPAAHLPTAVASLKAGKHVLVEKPLGHGLAACRELVEYCEKHNVPHGHGFSGRYAPIWQYVKKLLEAETLGKVVSVSAATMHAGGLAFTVDNWRFVANHNPGGPLFQCGIHKIDLLLFLFGEGRWTAGHVNRSITSTPTDDAYVLLGMFGGVPTTFHSHYVAAYRHAMEIYGTKGDLFITEYPEKLEYKATDLKSGFEPLYDIREKIPQTNTEMESLRDFAVAVRERRQPKMNGREGLQAMELILDAVRVSTEVR